MIPTSGPTIPVGFQPRSRAPANFMAAAGFGSFAYIGHQTRQAPGAGQENLYLAIEVGEVCQLRCRHCIYHESKPVSPRPSDATSRLVRDAFADGLDPLWVSFSGKEPTLFPGRLLELAKLSRRPDRINILMTNGLRLKGSLLDELTDVIDYFDVSLDGTEEAHDWMRGKGTFRKTWNNLEDVVANSASRIGVIATAVHSRLDNGRKQYRDLLDLAQLLKAAFGIQDRISLTISPYFGPPSDSMLLTEDDIVGLLAGLCEIDFPCHFLVTSNYAHLWPRITRRFQWTDAVPEYDDPTGLPFLRHGQVLMVLFNETEVTQLGLRISNEGRTYLSCNHLTLGARALRYQVGSPDEKLTEIVDRVRHNRHPITKELLQIPNDCLDCADFGQCRGGDALSGLLFHETPADPYCSQIERRH